ncbi:MAG: retropepsin-like aspartic protease [archaeon]|nr:retropepsin-like aspartic protease [archaeon]
MVKYRFDPSAPVITVYAEIEGEIIARPKMALDTGATYTMIPWDIAEVLGYKPELSKDRVPLVTASGVERAPLITLKSISVLGEDADNVQTVIHNLPEKSYVDGLLGLSFLRRFKICLDFRVGILEIE